MKTIRKKVRKAFPPTTISKEARKSIDEAMRELESIGWVYSEAEVATDHLAGELRSAFFTRKEARFAGKNPSLYDVIELVSERYGLSEDAVELAEELKSRIEDAYREDDDDDEIIGEIKELADILIVELRKFIASIELV